MKKEFTIEEIKEIANQLACPKGDKGDEIAFRMNESNKEMTEEAIRYLNVKESEKVIEIGIGNGHLSIPVLEKLGKSGSYLGIDLSLDMINKAQELFNKKEYPETHFIHGNALEVKVDQKYDKLFAVNLLYFIEDFDTFIKVIKLWLRPDAKVVFAIRAKETLEKLPVTQFGFNIRSNESIIGVLKDNKMKNINIHTFEEKADTSKQLEVDFSFINHVISFDI